ncbi:FYVE and coiled-coil domain-containing protein 1-like isoform X1 [Syngnathus acus]|uniref:FYVE and coiled-coil domain-containing protein 1-like isoform X1 n=1 Tax=Syngnathus acus TaxID=161584 RepID=UPI0018863F95|nr:FYVE and coiled-coil domain-containing protein 1-like isoform X1 [Syngnathus acus]XP_037131215.1 FYVE and coiled-coil domain-containing protein 1-like isoform X1 [Syngnathus acus]XP_037131216.1 FYVE and coiled-coil domain-containing protein 1-like isoform X1 [Syngnathus acus]
MTSSGSSVGQNQLHRIIRDLHDAVFQLSQEHKDLAEPVTDDSTNLRKFFYKLEYLLQFDLKEKTTFLGQRKDYWDYFCDCLIKIKGVNDGIRFVKSIPELKTSLGKGRAFIRYALVHQRLADTLQQCLINEKVTSDWYYARSPFLDPNLTSDIINHLYELNQIQFDVAARGYDLDIDWPAFARRTLGAGSASLLWKPPSRCSSINSLIQSQEVRVPDLNLRGDLAQAEPSLRSVAENLRLELDQSEVRQQELLRQVEELGKEPAHLKDVVKNLKEQLVAAQKTTSLPNPSASMDVRNHYQTCWDEKNCELQDRLAATENKNMELLSKLDETIKEKGKQTSSFCESAWKIQELLEKLKSTEEKRLEAKREAEDRARYCDRVSQELKLREEELRTCTEKLADVKSRGQDERAETLKRLEELQGAVGRIQGALTLKEKESGNLRAQLQGLQASLECRERQADELRRRLQEERDEIERRCTDRDSQNETLEVQLLDLRKTLKSRERELSVSSEKIKHLEEHLEKVNMEKESLSFRLEDIDLNASVETGNLDNCRSQCCELKGINTALLQAVKKSEDSVVELTQGREALLDQLAILRASEKHLKGRLEAADLCTEDREKKFLDENCHLEELVQKALLEKQRLEAQQKSVEQENLDLLEVQSSLKKQLTEAQEEVDLLNAKVSNLDENLTGSQKSHAELLMKFQQMEVKLKDQTAKCGLLQERVEELESRTSEQHDEKGAAESNEKTPKLHEEHLTPDSKEAPFRLVIAEAQLELNLREVHRLREEVVELRAQLLAGTEEKMKAQAFQEVTEASREDLRVLVEQLKGQVEELNRQHVDEILRSREREEALIRERDCEALARAGLAAEVTANKEELHILKQRYDALCLENSESGEALHRANTETAELGVRVCTLTAENEEARLRLETHSKRRQALEEEAAQEATRIDACTEQLRQENQQLVGKLRHQDDLWAMTQKLQEELTKVQEEAEVLQEKSRQEIEALRLELSSQAISHSSQLQSVNEELMDERLQMMSEQEKAVEVEKQLKRWKTEVQRYRQHLAEKTIQLAQSENLLQQKEDELIQLRKNLSRCQEELDMTQRACQELRDTLRKVTLDKQNLDLRTAAELDDLYRTKVNLEERLVELIRDKDALWQKTDALEFEQKLRDEETERDVNYCLGCHTPFGWLLRKHSCRSCGRPFCHYCLANAASYQMGGTRELCCRDCRNQVSGEEERPPQEDTFTSTPGSAIGRLLQPLRAVTSLLGVDEGDKQEDGIFDIITEEEVSGISDGDSFVTACSSGHGQEEATQLSCSSASTGDLSSEVLEDQRGAMQDAEICLLKSGELTLTSCFALDDISSFGDSSRELFIKSNCYSTVPISAGWSGATVCWTFTSEPKGISFSVVFQESAQTTLEQAKVLIPLTRCNSHKETIRGEMKVRKAGEYILIFDNSFSRFISKRVMYHLAVDALP